MVELALDCGTRVLLDAEDYDRLRERRLTVARHFNNPYPYVMAGGKPIHREIMGAPKGVVVDHINGDTLDNRKANLRLASHRENCRNQKPHKDKRVPYKGVTYMPKRNKYWARIVVDYRTVSLGLHRDPIAAACAYDAAARKYFGEFARLNFKK